MVWSLSLQVYERGPRRPEPLVEHREDLELVERMLAGDENAFEAFGERSFKAVYRFAFARLAGDRELTREIVQTAIAKALSRLATYRGEAALLTWLCACCRNEILMHFRRKQTTPAEVKLEEELAPDPGFASSRPSGPEAGLLNRERAHLVHAALEGLPPSYAKALEWKYLDSLSVNEIAWRLRMRPKAAESLLTRARQAFRKSYESLEALPHMEGPDHG
jgi:RNA polymerase sigma-70 factor, ECF subfamily